MKKTLYMCGENRLSGEPSDHGTDDRDYWGEILLELGRIAETDYAIEYVVPEFLMERT